MIVTVPPSLAPRRPMALRSGVACSLLAASLVGAAAHGEGYGLRLVAQTGDPAPGSFGGTFSWLGWPTLNASGQVAFAAGTSGAIADTGLWRSVFDDPQSLELIIGEDYPVPGSPPEIRFGPFEPSLHHPLLNDNGQVGFSARLTALPDPATGLFRMVNGSVQRVAVPGDIAPGTGGTLTYQSISNLPSFNASNAMAFSATLAGPGVVASNDRAFFAHWFGGVNMYLREGNTVPGMPGATFAFSTFSHPALEDSGAISFAAAIVGPGAAPWSLWRGWPAAMTKLAKSGDPAPLGGVFGGGPAALEFWSVSPGDGAQAFLNTLVTPAAAAPAIFRKGESELEAVAVTGFAGPLGTYDAVQDYTPPISSDGSLAFWAGFAGGSAMTDSAIVRASVGEPSMVLLREGDAAEGFGPGVVVDELAAWWIQSPIINDARQVLVEAFVRGPGITPDNDAGLWVIDEDGSIELVVREGAWLALGGLPPRQVDDWVVGSGNSERGGRRPSFNARGDIAMVLFFTDGSDAVVVAQRPDPCAADLNDDGVVDAADLAVLLGEWGTTVPVGKGADVDWDGDIDGADLAVLLGAWGGCA